MLSHPIQFDPTPSHSMHPISFHSTHRTFLSHAMSSRDISYYRPSFHFMPSHPIPSNAILSFVPPACSTLSSPILSYAHPVSLFPIPFHLIPIPPTPSHSTGLYQTLFITRLCFLSDWLRPRLVFHVVRADYEFEHGRPAGAVNIPAFFSTAQGMTVNRDFVDQASICFYIYFLFYIRGKSCNRCASFSTRM